MQVSEPLALKDLTRLKPLPCPVPWPYKPLHMGPPSLPYPLALPALPCQTLLLCPVRRPYHPLQVRHPDLYPVPRPYYTSQVGPPLPLAPPTALALPALTGASALFNDLCYNTCLLLSCTFLLLSSFPFLLPKAHPATPKIIPRLKNNIFCAAFLLEKA